MSRSLYLQSIWNSHKEALSEGATLWQYLINPNIVKQIQHSENEERFIPQKRMTSIVYASIVYHRILGNGLEHDPNKERYKENEVEAKEALQFAKAQVCALSTPEFKSKLEALRQQANQLRDEITIENNTHKVIIKNGLKANYELILNFFFAAKRFEEEYFSWWKILFIYYQTSSERNENAIKAKGLIEKNFFLPPLLNYPTDRLYHILLLIIKNIILEMHLLDKTTANKKEEENKTILHQFLISMPLEYIRLTFKYADPHAMMWILEHEGTIRRLKEKDKLTEILDIVLSRRLFFPTSDTYPELMNSLDADLLLKWVYRANPQEKENAIMFIFSLESLINRLEEKDTYKQILSEVKEERLANYLCGYNAFLNLIKRKQELILDIPFYPIYLAYLAEVNISYLTESTKKEMRAIKLARTLTELKETIFILSIILLFGVGIALFLSGFGVFTLIPLLASILPLSTLMLTSGVFVLSALCFIGSVGMAAIKISGITLQDIIKFCLGAPKANTVEEILVPTPKIKTHSKNPWYNVILRCLGGPKKQAASDAPKADPSETPHPPINNNQPPPHPTTEQPQAGTGYAFVKTP